MTSLKHGDSRPRSLGTTGGRPLAHKTRKFQITTYLAESEAQQLVDEAARADMSCAAVLRLALKEYFDR